MFGETHLKAKKAFMEDRKMQTEKIVQFFSDNFKDIPVIFGGDFNEEPQNPPISENMESKFIDLYQLAKPGHYPDFTTFKFREKEGYVKHCIDYMFLAKNEA